MRTRTLLTTPPGQEPVDDHGADDGERYVGGLELPVEPRVPGRYRRLIVTVLVVAVLGVVGYGGYRLVTGGQYQDPALSGTDAPTEPATGTTDPS